MVWFCPTYGRPKRLRELAKSWERCAKNVPLHIRLYSGDKRFADYQSAHWPKNWFFYITDTMRAGHALQEFYTRNPTADSYGFIADDIVLRSKGGLEHLEALAEPCFIAYPNDTIQRERLCTHFCIGGELVRTVGWLCMPGITQSFDMPWMLLGGATGLLRYAPGVIFEHKHFLVDKAPKDAAYQTVYPGNTMTPTADFIKKDHAVLEAWQREKSGMLADVIKIKRVLYEQYEDPEEWEAQDRADRIIVPESV